MFGKSPRLLILMVLVATCMSWSGTTYGVDQPADLAAAEAALTQAQQSVDAATATLAANMKKKTDLENAATTSVAALKKEADLGADVAVLEKLEALAAKTSLAARQVEVEVADAEQGVTAAKTALQVAHLAVRMATLESVADIEQINTSADAARASADGAKTAADGAKLSSDGAKKAADSAKLAADNAKLAADGAKLASDDAKLAADGAKLAADGAKNAADGIQNSADRLEAAAMTATEAANIAQQAAERVAQAPATTPAAAPSPKEADGNIGDDPSVPPHQSTDEATKECKSIDPFVRLPLVTTIGQAKGFDDFCPDNAEHDGKRCDCGRTFVRDYRFDAAAHFPLPAFGMRGESIEHEGAVIHEGMRFAMSDDGHYQIRFALETPAMPVTLRLQLLLEDSATHNRYTLTLPPITIPEPNRPEHTTQRREVDPVYAKVQTVHHEGYSPVLVNRSSTIQVVRRTGTARFGFGVNVP